MSLDTAVMLSQLDALRTLVWQNSKDGAKNRNRPESVLEKLLHPEEEKKEDLATFTSGADFDSYRASLLERAKDV